MTIKDYSNTRILLNIDLTDRSYRYSDRDGIAHNITTSTEGRVIVEDDLIQYHGVIVNAGEIKQSVSIENNSPSIGNVSIKIFNKDNLQNGNKPVALESGNATLYFVVGDMYDDIISSFTGKIDNVSFDDETLSFQIRNEEIVLFKNVPDIIFDEKTFQTKLVLFNAKIFPSGLIVMRYGDITTPIWGYTANLERSYVKRIQHPDLSGHVTDYWVGSRVDVVDANGNAGDPESTEFAIGEFAVVISSDRDEVVFPTIVDRYLLYTFIDDNLRDNTGTDPAAPYEVHDIPNNTMRNTRFYTNPVLKNPNFDVDSDWSKDPDWSIGSGVATKVAGASTRALYQDIAAMDGVEYELSFDMTRTAGTLTPYIAGTYGPAFSSSGHVDVVITGGSANSNLVFYGDAAFAGTVDNVRVRTVSEVILQIIRKPVPENADSVGRPLPIVYGYVEKLWAVWAVSAKSTRQNSLSAGDDLYIIASHPIVDNDPTEILVYFGLDENAQGQNFKPGTIDYVPNPLPRSIAEIDHWQESGYSLVSSDPTQNVSPFHKLLEITTNKGDIVTAVKLRGDEYTGWFEDNVGSALSDGDCPGINGQPQFPIRYGLGNSKLYVSFRGYKDVGGEITGIPDGLIEHPIDILKHFLLHYTNIDGDFSKLNEQSFADSKANLENWKFGLAITDTANGKDIVDRICKQCHSVWQFINGQFRVDVFNLDNYNATIYIDEIRDFEGEKSWSRPPLSEIYNDFIFKYKYNSIKEKFDGVIVRNKKNDQLCRNSFSYYGVIRSFDEIELPDIYDSFTANAYADHIVKLYSMQRLTLDANLRTTDVTIQLRPTSIVNIKFRDDSAQSGNHVYLCTDMSVNNNKLKASFLQLDNEY